MSISKEKNRKTLKKILKKNKKYRFKKFRFNKIRSD